MNGSRARPPQSSRPAVVLGLSPTGLAAVRSLGAMNVPCVGVYANPRIEIGRHSKYLAETRNISTPLTHPAFLNTLREATRAWEGSRPILIPSSDPYAKILSDQQDELRQEFELRCPPSGLHADFVDKAQTLSLCREFGMKIPRSTVADTSECVQDATSSFDFPVIVKPRRTFGIDFGAKNYVATSAQELLDFFTERRQVLGQAIIQEVIPSGDEKIIYVGTYSGISGRVMAAWTGRKIRQWVPDFGITCYGLSEDHPIAKDRVIRFLDRMQYRGFAGVEFAIDRRSGEYVFLELNPRLILMNRLAADAGIDLTRIAYDEMCGRSDRPCARNQRDGIYWIHFNNDLRSFRRKRRDGVLAAGSWIRSVLRARSFAVFDRRDLRPFFASFVNLIRLLRRRLDQTS